MDGISASPGETLLKLEVQISGMHCSGCCAAIETAVAPLPGVTRCEVRSGGAELTFDDAQTSVARVLESIRGAGPFDITSFKQVE